MATFNTNIVVPAAAIVTSLASATTNAQALAGALAGSGSGNTFGNPVTTLGTLANSTTNWRYNLAEMAELLASAQSDLSVAQQKFTVISSMIASIGALGT